MKLANATAVIRPRNAWEAIDLGFRMVQRDFWALARQWSIATLPWVVVGFGLGVVTGYFGYSILLIWWLKPAFDRVLLSYLSQRLFSEQTSPPRFVDLIFKIPWSYSVWRHLTYLRFSFARSFVLPIYQLEGQERATLAERITTIVARDYSAATWLTVTLGSLALLVQFAVLILFIGAGQSGGVFQNPLELLNSVWFEESERSVWYGAIDFLLFFVVQSVLEFFYVAAGFALYLNRRTHLEAWDIELAFRRLAQRLSKGTSIIVVVVMSVSLHSYDVSAAQDVETTANATPPVTRQADISHTDEAILSDRVSSITNATPASERFSSVTNDTPLTERISARKIVQSIEQSDEFGEMETRKEWHLIKSPDSEKTELDWDLFDWDWSGPGDLSVLLAGLFKLILAALLLSVVFIWFLRYRHLLLGTSRKSQLPEQEVSRPLSQSLSHPFAPDPQVPEHVLQLWQANQSRAALSYLYRSSLTYLTKVHNLIIQDNYTEHDCLQLVRQHAHEKVHRYFRQVTTAWSTLAYGQMPVDTEQVDQLCSDWALLAEPLNGPH